MNEMNGTTRLMAEKLTDGNASALARMLGMTLRAVQYHNRVGSSTPTLEFIASLFDVFSVKIGSASTKDAFHEAAKRLGREPGNKKP